ncbi:MAG: hypothetical protein KXJ49_00475 [Vulcanococcus sp.]|uniref:hypothetical protein n=1 Tax=Vulcanococcus sp. TaxID=2856995 RepID=UPI0025D63424|nr:hypothetical protein [Vulcanococcus sp.]MBW0165956.1 hypothetical protein [Vulcanococcus sp.]
MAEIRDSITGIVSRRYRMPSQIVFERPLSFGYTKSAKTGHILVTEGNDQNKATKFDVYADVDRDLRFTPRDVRIGQGAVLPSFVGGYESLLIGPYGTFSGSRSNGTFSILYQGEVAATGVLFL